MTPTGKPGHGHNDEAQHSRGRSSRIHNLSHNRAVSLRNSRNAWEDQTYVARLRQQAISQGSIGAGCMGKSKESVSAFASRFPVDGAAVEESMRIYRASNNRAERARGNETGIADQ